MLNNTQQVVKAHVGIKPDNHSAGTITGTGIDTLNFQHAMIVVHAGTNGSSGTVNVHVEESDSLATGYTDVTGAAFTEITEANDNTVYVGALLLNPRKRYIRVIMVVGTAACDASALVLLGGADDCPVSQVNTLAFNVKS